MNRILDLSKAIDIADELESDLDYEQPDMLYQELIPGLALLIKRYAERLDADLGPGTGIQVLDEVVRLLDDE